MPGLPLRWTSVASMRVFDKTSVGLFCLKNANLLTASKTAALLTISKNAVRPKNATPFSLLSTLKGGEASEWESE